MESYLVADLFCGAGGSSTGAERAVKDLGAEMVLVCVNHWPVAIETHKRNHPLARHYVEDVSIADPYKIVPEGRLDLLMASPECRFYSRARGGKPVHDQGRMNPWATHRWLTSLDIKCLLVENVSEFVNWGPLLPNGKPDPAGKGLYFQSWLKALWEMGYSAEWRFLNAANYGDATTRTRFFLIARKDGRSISWPEPTHSAEGGADMIGKLHKWRAAREIIEWSNPGRSLLDDPKYVKRPLSEKTRRRIARGLHKFGGALAPFYIRLLGLESDEPGNGEAESFVMGKESSPAYRGEDDPINTLTTDGRPVLIQPTAYSFVLGQQSKSSPRNVKKPIPTISTHGAISVINPLMVKYYGTGICHPVDEPVPTVTTKDRVGLANPVIVPFRGERKGQKPRYHSVGEPVPTITAESGFALANPTIIPYYGDHKGKNEPRAHSIEEPLKTVTTEPRFGLAFPVLVDVNHAGGADRSRSVDKPLSTVTGKRGTSLVSPFMVQWDQAGRKGQNTRSVDEPVPTIVTKQSIGIVESQVVGLVEPILRRMDAGEIDPKRLVLINDEPWMLDIRFRMLTNLELARAMGFSDQESTYEFAGNVSEVTKQIGNAVPVNMAKALVKSIFEVIR